jgi:hypothetical protein
MLLLRIEKARKEKQRNDGDQHGQRSPHLAAILEDWCANRNDNPEPNHVNLGFKIGQMHSAVDDCDR